MKKKQGGSFLLGLFLGLVAGLAIALGVAFYLSKTPLPFLGKAKPPAAKDGEKAPGEAPKAVAGMPQGDAKDRPKFDFYKILPGGEEPVTEREIKDAAKAAAAAKGQPGQPGQPEAAKGTFFIQAGSFQNPADADNQKAKIAILGFSSSVEPTALPDKGTWYRVRIGPYASLDELNRVRRVLKENGIEASLVKLKDVEKAN